MTESAAMVARAWTWHSEAVNARTAVIATVDAMCAVENVSGAVAAATKCGVMGWSPPGSVQGRAYGVVIVVAGTALADRARTRRRTSGR